MSCTDVRVEAEGSCENLQQFGWKDCLLSSMQDFSYRAKDYLQFKWHMSMTSGVFLLFKSIIASYYPPSDPAPCTTWKISTKAAKIRPDADTFQVLGGARLVQQEQVGRYLQSVWTWKRHVSFHPWINWPYLFRKDRLNGLVVTGTFYFCSRFLEFHHRNWRTHIFQDWLKPPTR